MNRLAAILLLAAGTCAGQTMTISWPTNAWLASANVMVCDQAVVVTNYLQDGTNLLAYVAGYAVPDDNASWSLYTNTTAGSVTVPTDRPSRFFRVIGNWTAPPGYPLFTPDIYPTVSTP